MKSTPLFQRKYKTLKRLLCALKYQRREKYRRKLDFLFLIHTDSPSLYERERNCINRHIRRGYQALVMQMINCTTDEDRRMQSNFLHWAAHPYTCDLYSQLFQRMSGSLLPPISENLNGFQNSLNSAQL